MKKNKYLASILFLLLSVYSNAQDTIVYSGISNILNVDNVSFIVKKEKVGSGRKSTFQTILLKDTLIIDTLDNSYGYNIFCNPKNNSFFIIKGLSVFELKPSTGIVGAQNIFNGTFMSFSNPYLVLAKAVNSDSEFLLNEIILFDVKRNIAETVVSLSDQFINYHERIINVTYSSNSKLFFIETGVDYGGGHDDCQQFIYNNNTKIIELAENQSPSCIEYNMMPDINGKYFFSDKSIYDNVYNIISPILRNSISNYSKSGYKIINSNLNAIYVTSEITSNNKYGYENVVIPISRTMELEKGLYEVYSDTLLSSNMLNRMQVDNLFLLKNMVYAKNNYEFPIRYYEAFFNLYHFYSNRINSRKKRVEHKFTPTDKANLKLIEQAINNKKSQNN